MSMTDHEWKDLRKDVNRGGLFGLGWLITLIIIVALVSVAGWAFTVVTSDIRGQGDATIQKNSGTNRIFAQQYFEETYQEILAADRRIDVMKEALDATPDDPTAKTNFTGATTYCFTVVGDYNAEARKFLSEQFRSASLPSEIDNNNSITDCKPTQAR